jgi:KDO2-lipid IV(A) lauroyltransferase
LYLLSDWSFLWLYYIVKYRRHVVAQNLANAFPENSDKERRQIARRFYRHLCDLVVESIKLYAISRRQVQKRMHCVNPQVLNQFGDKTVVLIGGHYSNWEWYAAFAQLHTPQQAVALYTPIRNTFLDRKMKKARQRFGIRMVNARQLASVYRDSLRTPLAVIYATDQNPPNPEAAWWLNFLNQDTGVMMGTEHFAVKGNHPVIYGELRKPRRGHYEVEYRVLCERPADTTFGEITALHTAALEESIRKRPELWLWSHKRWKHKRPEHANQPR